jgi:tetratricopeptide (TPR) repeat protein
MSPRIRRDPNLVSAEIAFSELMGKKSKFIDAGIRLKDDSNISILEKNELLAQIATLEFSHGKNSKGKILINECLKNPNENSLAQIAFLEKKRYIDPVEVTNSSAIFQFEALARHYFANANFQKSYECAKLWYNFQPFTNFPAVLSTYIAIEILGRYQEAIDIAEEALKISPNSISLKNNLAFSYAKNGQSDKAINIISSINRGGLDNYNKAILNATTGYIAYKIGNMDSAKYGYNEAITYFRTNKEDEESLARALYNYADILDKNEKIVVLKEVEELSKKNNIIELKYLLDKEV